MENTNIQLTKIDIEELFELTEEQLRALGHKYGLDKPAKMLRPELLTRLRALRCDLLKGSHPYEGDANPFTGV